MDGDPAGQAGPLSIAEAKRRLLEPSDSTFGSLPDPLEWVRKHPKEAVAIAAAFGIVMGTMPRLRRNMFSLAIDAARAMIK